MPDLSRRALLSIGILGATAIASRAIAAEIAPPKETGLSFEGLLKGQAGFQPRKVAPRFFQELPGFISRQQMDRAYAAYRDAFKRLDVAESALKQLPRDLPHASDYAAMKAQQLEAANAVLMWEFFFRNLSRSKMEPSSYVMDNMNEHMGSIESWRADFTMCAGIAPAWAALVYDPYDDRWHNVALGAENVGGWVGSNPLVVCATGEDAWMADYKSRDAYVTAFLDHLDWNEVAKRYRAVDRH